MSELITSEMEERIARAHAEFAGCAYEPDKSFWDGTARVALDALYEPTEAMLDAASYVPWDSPNPIRDRWHKMIDAARK